MGPQNQVGMHETTNLFIQRETFIKTTDLDTGLRDVAAVNANIHVKKNSAVRVEFNSSYFTSLSLVDFLLHLPQWPPRCSDGHFKSFEFL